MVSKTFTGVDLHSKIQAKIVEWSRRMAATGVIPCLALLHSNLTGAKLTRGGFQWGVLVAEGALAGIPDLHLPVPSPLGYNSMYVELKTPLSPKLRTAQKKVINILKEYNNYVVVINGSDEFEALEDFKVEIATYLNLCI